jgi:hypothetical protein
MNFLNKIDRITKLAVLGLTLGLSSCTEEIMIDLENVESKIVIEASLTDQNEPQKVQISKTVNFSESNTFPAISGATVSISDNKGLNYILKESKAGLYESIAFRGVPGLTYTLTVKVEGKTYTAQSTMPQAVKVESLKYDISNLIPPGADKDRYLVFPQFIDPKGLGNSYRFIQKTDKGIDKSIIIGNDNIGDGLPYSRPVVSLNFEIKKGDKYSLEMQCIDKAVYDYYFTLQSVAGNGPGGGTTPTNPPSNISGGALGIFSAHTVQVLSTEIK